jgi:hypothetical protein
MSSSLVSRTVTASSQKEVTEPENEDHLFESAFKELWGSIKEHKRLLIGIVTSAGIGYMMKKKSVSVEYKLQSRKAAQLRDDTPYLEMAKAWDIDLAMDDIMNVRKLVMMWERQPTAARRILQLYTAILALQQRPAEAVKHWNRGLYRVWRASKTFPRLGVEVAAWLSERALAWQKELRARINDLIVDCGFPLRITQIHGEEWADSPDALRDMLRADVNRTDGMGVVMPEPEFYQLQQVFVDLMQTVDTAVYMLVRDLQAPAAGGGRGYLDDARLQSVMDKMRAKPPFQLDSQQGAVITRVKTSKKTGAPNPVKSSTLAARVDMLWHSLGRRTDIPHFSTPPSRAQRERIRDAQRFMREHCANIAARVNTARRAPFIHVTGTALCVREMNRYIAMRAKTFVAQRRAEEKLHTLVEHVWKGDDKAWKAWTQEMERMKAAPSSLEMLHAAATRAVVAPSTIRSFRDALQWTFDFRTRGEEEEEDQDMRSAQHSMPRGVVYIHGTDPDMDEYILEELLETPFLVGVLWQRVPGHRPSRAYSILKRAGLLIPLETSTSKGGADAVTPFISNPDRTAWNGHNGLREGWRAICKHRMRLNPESRVLQVSQSYDGRDSYDSRSSSRSHSWSVSSRGSSRRHGSREARSIASTHVDYESEP